MDIWPDIPPAVRLKSNIGVGTLVLVKRIIYVQGNGHCETRDDYLYSGTYIVLYIYAYYEQIGKYLICRHDQKLHSLSID